MIRWPGHIKPAQVSSQIVSGLDWFPTLLAAAGDTGVTDRLLKGWQIGPMTYKDHLDGYNILPYLEGAETSAPRKSFFYFNDDGQLVAIRYENWKQVFCEQRVEGTLRIWAEPFTCLRLPKLFNLRMDSYERADITSNTYYEWLLRHSYLGVPTQALAAQFLATFKEYPPRQKPASFNLDDVVNNLLKPSGG